MKRLMLLVVLVALHCGAAQAQKAFLGGNWPEGTKYTPTYGIPYESNGYEHPPRHKVGAAINRGASLEVQNLILAYPEVPISVMIEDGYTQALASFTACGGTLPARARAFNPASIHVTIEPTIWWEPTWQTWFSGGYYPDQRHIRVVNIYYGTTGMLGYSRSLLVWEFKNAIATDVGISTEPNGSPAWPCDAPGH